MSKSAKSVRFPNLVLRVSFDNSMRGYYHITARPANVDDSSLYRHESGGSMRGVYLHSQADTESLARIDERSTFGGFYGVALGWKGDYRDYCDLTECIDGAAALKIIQKYMDKAIDDHGKPASFGAYIQRLCAAIGLDKVCVPNRKDWISPSNAAYLVDNQIHDWTVAAREALGVTV